MAPLLDAARVSDPISSCPASRACQHLHVAMATHQYEARKAIVRTQLLRRIACGNMHRMQEYKSHYARRTFLGRAFASRLQAGFFVRQVFLQAVEPGLTVVCKLGRWKFAEPKLGSSQYNMHVNKDFWRSQCFSSARICSEWSFLIAQIVWLELNYIGHEHYPAQYRGVHFSSEPKHIFQPICKRLYSADHKTKTS
jgi:hypothetical protein